MYESEPLCVLGQHWPDRVVCNALSSVMMSQHIVADLNMIGVADFIAGYHSGLPAPPIRTGHLKSVVADNWQHHPEGPGTKFIWVRRSIYTAVCPRVWI